MKTPFKMKSSPTKDKLGDFFRTITKKATPETKAKRAEAKKTRKAGESQYQADVRAKRATSRANKKVNEGELTKNIVNTSQKGDEAVRPKKATVANKPESKAYVPQEFKGKAGDEFRYRKTGTHGELNDYTSFEFMKPGSNTWTKAEPVDGDYSGMNRINELFAERRNADELFDSPVEKKSPYKKGLGSYAKKAKGSRGYKMKRK